MAYQFNGTNQYLSASAPLTAAPITFSCWVRPLTTLSGDRALIELTAGSTGHVFLFYAAGGLLSFFVNTSTFTQIQGGNISLDTWHHCVAIEASTTSRFIYLNGTQTATGGVSKEPLGITELNIAADKRNNTLGLYMPGQIADAGVWNVALTAAEIASLAKGVTCNRVRPQSLKFYAPLVRNLQDVRDSRTITNNNTATVANHPRVYQ